MANPLAAQGGVMSSVLLLTDNRPRVTRPLPRLHFLLNGENHPYAYQRAILRTEMEMDTL